MKPLDFLAETSIRQQQAAAQRHLERQLLVREALADRRVRFYQPALIRLGRQLVVWGTQLQRFENDLPSRAEMAFSPQPK